MSVFPEERRQLLVRRARDEGRVDVAAVSEELDVAPETIRRDLNLLESHGLVRRTHGGAIPVERLGFEGALTTRAVTMSQEKARIAEAAARLTADAESVYLDEGSTTQMLVDTLPVDRPLTVVTNAVPVAVTLAEREGVTVLLVGGRVRGRTLGTVDQWAPRMVSELVLDLAFLGTNGISPGYGLTTPDPAVAEVKRAAVAAARRRVLLADHTKFGIDSFCRFAEVRELEAIVTDEGLADDRAEPYRALGVEVVRA